MLKRIEKKLYHVIDGVEVDGIHQNLRGNVSEDLRGDVSDLRGDIDECEFDRTKPTNINDLAE